MSTEFSRRTEEQLNKSIENKPSKSHSVQYQFLAQEVPGLKTGGGVFWAKTAMKLPGFYLHLGIGRWPMLEVKHEGGQDRRSHLEWAFSEMHYGACGAMAKSPRARRRWQEDADPTAPRACVAPSPGDHWSQRRRRRRRRAGDLAWSGGLLRGHGDQSLSRGPEKNHMCNFFLLLWSLRS